VYVIHFYLQILIDRGVDVNTKSGNDPDLIFKALVLREMGLAKQIADSGYVSIYQSINL
jgi:hypothetical protein